MEVTPEQILNTEESEIFESRPCYTGERLSHSEPSLWRPGRLEIRLGSMAPVFSPSHFIA